MSEPQQTQEPQKDRPSEQTPRYWINLVEGRFTRRVKESLDENGLRRDKW